MSTRIAQLHPQPTLRVPVRSLVMSLLYYHVCIAGLYFMISPVFGGLYAYLPGGDVRYLLVSFYAVMLACQVPKFRRPSDLGVTLLVLTIGYPTLSYFVICGGSIGYITAVMLGILAYDGARRIPLSVNINASVKFGHVLAVSFLFVGIVVTLMLQNFQIHSLSALLLDLYGLRADVVDAHGGSSSIQAYIQSWTHSIILPFLFLYFYTQRNWLMLGVCAALLLLFFLTLTGKSILFNPLLALGLYLLLKPGRDMGSVFVAVSMIFIISFSLYVILDNSSISSLLLRRTLFVPVMLNNQYHELFGHIGHVYYSHSVLSFLSDYPFAKSYQSLVGEYTFGNELAHANTGIFGTGFMHFSYLGVVVFPSIMGLLASYVDRRKISLERPAFTAAITAVATSTIFSSADLFSGILTNGYLVVLLYVTICGRQPATQETNVN